MAAIQPTFDLMFLGSGQTTGTRDDWFDMSSWSPNPNSPIPSGKQLWLGIGTFIAEDKAMTFEVRPNLPGQSAGTPAATQMRGMAAVASGESKDIDFYFGGVILSLAPTSAVSTGVEKLWLRVKSGSAVVGNWSALMFYTVY